MVMFWIDIYSEGVEPVSFHLNASARMEQLKLQ